jgi:hypothetical protein
MWADAAGCKVCQVLLVDLRCGEVHTFCAATLEVAVTCFLMSFSTNLLHIAVNIRVNLDYFQTFQLICDLIN